MLSNNLRLNYLPKFQVYKDARGKCRFRLLADNNKIVATGEAYKQYAGCINGVKSIQKNCNAAIEDTTVEGAQKIKNPKFEVYKDTADQFRFRLKASNGQIIAESEGYETKEACLDGVGVIRKSCVAEIEDQTVISESAEENVTSSKVDTIKQVDSVVTITGESIKETISSGQVDTTIDTIKQVDSAPTVVAAELAVKETSKKDEMIEELKRIRLSLEKGPQPQPPKGLWNEFKDFLKKYSILGLAVAFVLGLYLGAVVQALVKDFIMPLIGLIIPGMANLATFSVTALSQVFGIGDFLVALITFIIVALIVFLVVKVAKRWKID